MRKKTIKLQYIRPQTEVFATMGRPFMSNVTFVGGHNEGELDEIDDEEEEGGGAKDMDFDSDFSSYGTWKEYMWEEQ